MSLSPIQKTYALQHERAGPLPFPDWYSRRLLPGGLPSEYGTCDVLNFP
jgi:hypothetical protein